MKLLKLLSCLLLVAFVGQTQAIETTEEPDYTTTSTTTVVVPTTTYPTTTIRPTTTTRYTTTTMPPRTTTTKFTTIKPQKTTTTRYTTVIPTITTTNPTERPSRRPHKKPCGSNNLGDYKGSCDESVPVIVMPKGRPIMERVLDWFKCGTKSCLPEQPEIPTITSTGGK